MRELIEKLRAATEPSRELDRQASVAIFGGEMLISGPMEYVKLADGSLRDIRRLTSSIDVLNEVFQQVLPGYFRIGAKGRMKAEEPLYGYAIHQGELSEEKPPISCAEHDIEAIAYLIAILEALELKRDTAND